MLAGFKRMAIVIGIGLFCAGIGAAALESGPRSKVSAKPGDWSSSAFLSMPTGAQRITAPRAGNDPWWLAEMEAVGVGASGESLAIASTGTLRGQVALLRRRLK